MKLQTSDQLDLQPWTPPSKLILQWSMMVEYLYLENSSYAKQEKLQQVKPQKVTFVDQFPFNVLR